MEQQQNYTIKWVIENGKLKPMKVLIEIQPQQQQIEFEKISNPLGIEFRVYAFKCKYCGRVILDMNDTKALVKNAKRHLDSHKINYDKIVIGYTDITI
ncbi:MAG: hypothetical protein QW046_05675 [Candidatus Micrarchaeaceae archaeon]|uniref:hypothetical protein n=1 Tax=Saccharolobus sp. TaxID=2100761 RepID=UPI0031663BF8